MVKAVVKKSTHVTRRAFPINLPQVYKICDFLDAAPSAPKAVKACVLIGFACYLRSSNLTCTKSDARGGPHTLKVSDVVVTPFGVRANVNSTKSTKVPMSLLVQENSQPKYCPKQAWMSYVSIVNPNVLGPAFVITPGRPLTPGLLVDFMKAALISDPTVDTALISSHSLRRGATQNAANKDIAISEIMRRSGLRSKSGIAPYLSK